MSTDKATENHDAGPLLGLGSSEGLGLAPEREELRATLAECETAGEQAGRDGLPFDACPYQFVRAEVDQATFEAHWRPRLDAWFRGWLRTSPPIRRKYNPRWHKTPNLNSATRPD